MTSTPGIGAARAGDDPHPVAVGGQNARVGRHRRLDPADRRQAGVVQDGNRAER
jgi:hypothetical protein